MLFFKVNQYFIKAIMQSIRMNQLMKSSMAFLECFLIRIVMVILFQILHNSLQEKLHLKNI